jgi:pilus assembly protein CpaB
MAMKLSRKNLLLTGGIFTALATAALSARWMMRQAEPRTTPILVASVTLESGLPIGAKSFEPVNWPTTLLPPGAIRDAKQLEGRQAQGRIPKGFPILESQLSPAGAHGGLAAIIASGKRAMTVRVNEVVGVAGFALPGNFVDVVVNTPGVAPANLRGGSLSRIVLEHVPVLAVAQEFNRDETKPRVVNAVTLEVSPAEAEKLDLARSIGSLSLVLRNQNDPSPARTKGASPQTLLGDATAFPSRPYPASEIIRGSERSLTR